MQNADWVQMPPITMIILCTTHCHSPTHNRHQDLGIQTSPTSEGASFAPAANATMACQNPSLQATRFCAHFFCEKNEFFHAILLAIIHKPDSHQKLAILYFISCRNATDLTCPQIWAGFCLMVRGSVVQIQIFTWLNQTPILHCHTTNPVSLNPNLCPDYFDIRE